MRYFKSTLNVYQPFDISTVQRPIRYKVGRLQRFGVKENGYTLQVEWRLRYDVMH